MYSKVCFTCLKMKCLVFPFGVIVMASIFMLTLPWTSLESSFKPHVAHQFVVKIVSQKGTQQDIVVWIFLYIKGDRYAQKRLAIDYYN
jgi:hypothetical protein